MVVRNVPLSTSILPRIIVQSLPAIPTKLMVFGSSSKSAAYVPRANLLQAVVVAQCVVEGGPLVAVEPSGVIVVASVAAVELRRLSKAQDIFSTTNTTSILLYCVAVALRLSQRERALLSKSSGFPNDSFCTSRANGSGIYGRHSDSELLDWSHCCLLLLALGIKNIELCLFMLFLV